MPDRSSAQSREPDRPELAERGKASPAPAACERPLWRRILTPLALGVVGVVLFLLAIREYPSTPAGLPNPGPGQSREPDGTVPAGDAETVSQAISRVEKAAREAQTASVAVRQALADAARKRPLLRRILTPLALGVVSGVLFLLTSWVFPRPPAELSNYGPAQLKIITAATVTSVVYAVYTNGVEVTVHAGPPGRPRASVSEAVVTILVLPSPRTRHNQPTVKTVRLDSDFVAYAKLSVSPPAAGMAYNGLTATAAIPEVIIWAPTANPVLDARYNIPSGFSYDWSPFPPASLDYGLTWEIHLTTADTAGQMLAGANHARQDSDNFRTFIAGALFALAGAALLSAFQEALSRFAR